MRSDGAHIVRQRCQADSGIQGSSLAGHPSAGPRQASQAGVSSPPTAPHAPAPRATVQVRRKAMLQAQTAALYFEELPEEKPAAA